jgi:hypothetical protein
MSNGLGGNERVQASQACGRFHRGQDEVGENRALGFDAEQVRTGRLAGGAIDRADPPVEDHSLDDVGGRSREDLMQDA